LAWKRESSRWHQFFFEERGLREGEGEEADGDQQAEKYSFHDCSFKVDESSCSMYAEKGKGETATKTGKAKPQRTQGRHRVHRA
jgi:hypothetical protein